MRTNGLLNFEQTPSIALILLSFPVVGFDDVVLHDVKLTKDGLQVILIQVWKRGERVFEAVDDLGIQASIIEGRVLFQPVAHPVWEAKHELVLEGAILIFGHNNSLRTSSPIDTMMSLGHIKAS